MKKTYKKIARRTCFYLLFATTCWFVACLHEDGRHIDFEKHYELMSTRSLRETGIPDCFLLIRIRLVSATLFPSYNKLIPVIRLLTLSAKPMVYLFGTVHG